MSRKFFLNNSDSCTSSPCMYTNATEQSWLIHHIKCTSGHRLFPKRQNIFWLYTSAHTRDLPIILFISCRHISLRSDPYLICLSEDSQLILLWKNSIIPKELSLAVSSYNPRFLYPLLHRKIQNESCRRVFFPVPPRKQVVFFLVPSLFFSSSCHVTTTITCRIFLKVSGKIGNLFSTVIIWLQLADSKYVWWSAVVMSHFLPVTSEI